MNKYTNCGSKTDLTAIMQHNDQHNMQVATIQPQDRMHLGVLPHLEIFGDV